MGAEPTNPLPDCYDKNGALPAKSAADCGAGETPAKEAADNHSLPAKEATDNHSLSTKEATDNHSLPAKEATDNHSLPTKEATDNHSLPTKEATDNHSLPTKEATDNHSLPTKEATDNHSLPTKEATDNHSLPTKEATDNHSLPAKEATDNHSLPAKEATDNHSLPTKEATDNHSLPAKEAADNHSLPTKEAAENHSLPTKEAAENHSLPTKEATDNHSLPTKEATDNHSLPTKEATDNHSLPAKEATDNHDGLTGRQLSRQVFLGVVVSLATASTGAHGSLPAVVLPTLLSNSSDIQLTAFQGTWFASMHALSGILGSAVGGLCVHHLGPRRVLLLQLFPCTAGWVLMALAQNFAMLIVGRCLVGATSGLSLSASQVYLAECSSPQIRGRIVCINGMLVGMGSVMTFVLGALVPWRWVAAAPILALQVPGLLGMLLLPESPYWLMGRKRNEHARRSLKMLRNGNEQVVHKDLEIIEEACKSRHKALTWRELGRELRKPAVLAPFLTLEALFVLRIITGLACIVTYAIMIFEDAGSALGPYESAIVMSSLRLFNSMCCVLYISDNFGRRTLLLFSGVGCSTLGAAFSAFLILRDQYPAWTVWEHISWLPLPLILLWLIAFDVGFARTGWVVHAELLPNRVRSALSGVGICTHYISSFLSVFTFPFIRDACTLGGAFGVYTGFSVLCLLLVIFFIPETRNQRLETIEAFYVKRFGKQVNADSASDAQVTSKTV